MIFVSHIRCLNIHSLDNHDMSCDTVQLRTRKSPSQWHENSHVDPSSHILSPNKNGIFPWKPWDFTAFPMGFWHFPWDPWDSHFPMEISHGISQGSHLRGELTKVQLLLRLRPLQGLVLPGTAERLLECALLLQRRPLQGSGAVGKPAREPGIAWLNLALDIAMCHWIIVKKCHSWYIHVQLHAGKSFQRIIIQSLGCPWG